MKDFLDRCMPEPNSGCWIWIPGGKSRGAFQGKPAARAAYEIFIGPIEPGKHILHSCDLGICVNPAHLRQGTNNENIADWLKRGKGPRWFSYQKKKISRRDRIEIELAEKMKKAKRLKRFADKHNFGEHKNKILFEV